MYPIGEAPLFVEGEDKPFTATTEGTPGFVLVGSLARETGLSKSAIRSVLRRGHSSGMAIKGEGGIKRWSDVKRDYVDAVVWQLADRGRDWLARFEGELPDDWKPRPERLLEGG